MIPHRGGLPHSDIHGSKPARGSPWLFAACHVLHRLLVPRHPPNALIMLGRVPGRNQKPPCTETIHSFFTADSLTVLLLSTQQVFIRPANARAPVELIKSFNTPLNPRSPTAGAYLERQNIRSDKHGTDHGTPDTGLHPCGIARVQRRTRT